MCRSSEDHVPSLGERQGHRRTSRAHVSVYSSCVPSTLHAPAPALPFTGSVANTHRQIFDVPTVFVCALGFELDDAGPAVGAAVEVFG